MKKIICYFLNHNFGEWQFVSDNLKFKQCQRCRLKENYELITCKRCDGTKEVEETQSEYETCGVCNGEGTFREFISRESGYRWTQCRSCGGSGSQTTYFTSTVKCNNCDKEGNNWYLKEE